MKRIARYLACCTVLMMLTFGTAVSSHSLAPRVLNQDDPECRRECEQQLLECFFTVQRRSDEHKCVAKYRHCIAHCK